VKCGEPATRIVRITESAAQGLNRSVHSVFEIHEGIGRPELGLQFLARQQFAGLFEKHGENLKRAACEANFVPMLAEFASVQIDVVDAEAHFALKWPCIGHSAAVGES
jgi:hypothetical protein